MCQRSYHLDCARTSGCFIRANPFTVFCPHHKHILDDKPAAKKARAPAAASTKERCDYCRTHVRAPCGTKHGPTRCHYRAGEIKVRLLRKSTRSCLQLLNRKICICRASGWISDGNTVLSGENFESLCSPLLFVQQPVRARKRGRPHDSGPTADVADSSTYTETQAFKRARIFACLAPYITIGDAAAKSGSAAGGSGTMDRQLVLGLLRDAWAALQRAQQVRSLEADAKAEGDQLAAEKEAWAAGGVEGGPQLGEGEVRDWEVGAEQTRMFLAFKWSLICHFVCSSNVWLILGKGACSLQPMQEPNEDMAQDFYTEDDDSIVEHFQQWLQAHMAGKVASKSQVRAHGEVAGFRLESMVLCGKCKAVLPSIPARLGQLEYKMRTDRDAVRRMRPHHSVCPAVEVRGGPNKASDCKLSAASICF